MTKYLINGEYQGESEVPDPFHGGPEGFEMVRSCHVILHNLQVICTQNLLQLTVPYTRLSRIYCKIFIVPASRHCCMCNLVFPLQLVA